MNQRAADAFASICRSAGWVTTLVTLAVALIPSRSSQGPCGSTVMPTSRSDACQMIRTGLDLPLILAGLAVVFFVASYQLRRINDPRS